MEPVTVKCDRCGCLVDGIAEVVKFEGGQYYRATGGFYDVGDGYWGRFANYGEKYICDNCMHSDPRYKLVYR